LTNRVKLYNSSRYPTSIIIRGADSLGLEIGKSLLEQGGYVIFLDDSTRENDRIFEELKEYKLFTILDFSSISILENDLRRLDYVFYFQHQATSLTDTVSSQVFLQSSNYLDTLLDLSVKFEAKFLLTTSIKAHQMYFSNKSVDLNYSLDNQDRNSNYSELEIQRYSESLVKEYSEKVKLDARIIRLGIILGKSFELEEKSTLYKLIIDALNGDDLIIPGDGLDSDYYVHYLDAAYGIIKAQFSSNTTNKIYSLCNDELLSTLSIAYKLIEIIPESREIKFDTNGNEIPPLRLYKPAQNLSEIGWKPRISFDRALAQTIDEIKAEQMSQYAKNIVNNVNTQNKSGKTSIIKEATPEDALGKLIAERKNQERSRIGGIVLANKVKKDNERNEWNRGFIKRIDNTFNNFLFWLKKRFNFIKNMTVMDFFAWILIIFSFVIIYILLLAPIISLVKSVYVVGNIQNTLLQDINNESYKKGLDDISSANNELTNIQNRLYDIRYVFNILNADSQYNNYQQTVDDYLQVNDGLQLTLDSLIPFENYISSFNPNITYRYADNSILSVNNTSEYDQDIFDMKNRFNSFQLGINKFDQASQSLISDYDSMPSAFKSIYKLNSSDLTNYVTKFNSISSFYNLLPQIAGYEQTRNYLILFQDNSRYTPAGGYISGYMIIQVKNGGIKNIVIRNSNVLNGEVLTLSDAAFDEIKLVSDQYSAANSCSFDCLPLISNIKLFLSETQSVIELQENTKIDLTVVVNLRYLEQLITQFKGFNYKDTVYTSENLLDAINTNVDQTNAITSRNDIITNLFSIGFEKIFNSFRDNFQNIFDEVGSAISENNLTYLSTDPVFSNLNNNLPILADYSHSDFVFAGVNIDKTQTAINKYPTNTVALKINIQKDNSTNKSIDYSISGGENLQNSYICLPTGAKDFSLPNVASTIVSKSFSNDKVCYSFLKDPNEKYSILFDSLPFTVSKGDNIYTFALYTNPGISTNFDLTFSFASELGTIKPLGSDFVKNGASYIYSGRSTGEVILKFEIIKNG